MQGMRIKSHRNFNPSFNQYGGNAASWTTRPFSWKPPQTKPNLTLVPKPANETKEAAAKTLRAATAISARTSTKSKATTRTSTARAKTTKATRTSTARNKTAKKKRRTE